MLHRSVRLIMLIAAVVQLGFAAAFIAKVPAVIRLWPLPYTTDLSYLLIASIFAAAAASTLWCLFAREDGALAGVALDYIMIMVPLTIFAFQLASRSRSATMTQFAIACAVAAVFGLGLFLWSRRIPIRDQRPMPRLVRVSFMIFVAALLIAGGGLVLKTPNILPWRTSAEAGVIYGWMFLGAAAYFSYALLRPSWHNTAGQLAGFLAYDLVLIVPFILRFQNIEPQWRINLIIYVVVVGYSALLAIYYLFINRETRIISRQAAAPQVQPNAA